MIPKGIPTSPAPSVAVEFLKCQADTDAPFWASSTVWPDTPEVREALEFGLEPDTVPVQAEVRISRGDYWVDLFGDYGDVHVTVECAHRSTWPTLQAAQAAATEALAEWRSWGDTAYKWSGIVIYCDCAA